jgi:hypothetical protein
MGWVRDLLLPAFLRAGASSSAEFASYTVDFEARAA